jgi:hypothetical protein
VLRLPWPDHARESCFFLRAPPHSLREIMNKPTEGTPIRLTQLAHGGG